jgi:hypothetical protein
VCNGDGSSCGVGCDGIPWKNTQNDTCGICGGNNSTCEGGKIINFQVES